jgi:1-acyl-sn-glycerol-3-phosphate acyltransferase
LRDVDHPASARSVLLAPRFSAFFTAVFFSAFNDNFFKNAIVLLIGATRAEAFGLSPEEMITACTAVFILPFFVLSATAGQIADRYEKTQLIRFIKGAEVPIMALAAYGFAAAHVEALFAALFLMGIHSAFLGPVKYGVLPELLPAGELVMGNALVEMGTFLAILLGTIGGGVLVLAEGGPTWVGAGVVLFACCGFFAAMRMPTAGRDDPSVRVQWDLVRPTLEVLRITGRTRSVLLSVLGISWFWFLGACLLSIIPIYVSDTLGAEPRAATLLLTIFCVGIATGSLLTERISGKNLELGLVPFGSFGMSLAALDLYFVGAHPVAAGAEPRTIAALVAAPWAWRMLADLLGVALFGGFFTVPLYTLIQQRAEPGERARVVAGNNVLNALFMAVGSVALGLCLRAEVPVPTLFAGIAGLNLLAAIYIYSVVPEFLLRFLAWILSRLMYRLRLEGHEHVPETGGAVLVCNHVSFIDWLIVGGSVRRPLRFVMDHRIAGTPLVSTLFRHAKTIPIAPQREDPALMERAFARIAEELRAGELVCIFPEGKLTADGAMSVFKPGIERIVAETPVPVVPAALDGLWGSIFSRKDGPAMQKMPRRFRARLRLTIGAPIAPDAVSAPALEAEVRRLLEAGRAEAGGAPPPAPASGAETA